MKEKNLKEKTKAKRATKKITKKVKKVAIPKKKATIKTIEKPVKEVTPITKSKTTKKTTKKVTAKKIDLMKIANEFHELPYRYNQTVVKILAQSPTKLFVYWDISDEDRATYVTAYGEDFFNITSPYLKVKNETLNYVFDVKIDDFANSWYLNISDDNCKYTLELYRKPNKNTTSNNIPEFISVTISNEMDIPNGKILLVDDNAELLFRNIKTNLETIKQVKKGTYDFYSKNKNHTIFETSFLNSTESSR